MFPQDSITATKHVSAPVATTSATSDTVARPARQRTPYQVLSTLPRDATPAQQDSAIQASFQPAKIRYSEQPDTLHLPGHGPGTKLTNVDMPIYYKKTYFSSNALLHESTDGGRYGVSGDPVPYSMHGDNIIALLLLSCFVLTIVSFARSRQFFARQFKGFFHMPRTDDMFMPETSSELRFQFFLVAQTALLCSILQYDYTQAFIGKTFVLSSDYHLIGVFFLLFIGYFLVKAILYSIVNLVFFDTKRNTHWLKTLLFITAVEGVALFPAVLLLVYFDMKTENVMTYLIIVLILVKILTFYKCFVIFFRRIGVYLQIFLYLCALEIVPMAAFWGILILTGKLLKVNY